MGFDFRVPDLRLPDMPDLPYAEPISTRQTRQVLQATGQVKEAIEALADSSARIEKLTVAMIETSRDSNKQISALNESSAKMESLTVALRNLTVWLIVLGALTLLLPIGIEVWHSKREIDAPVSPIVIQYPVPTVPSPPHPAGNADSR